MSSQYNCDYITSLPLLKERAYEVSKGQWNNYNEDIGETLLKFLATTSHTIDYYYRKYLENLLLPCDNWNSKNLTFVNCTIDSNQGMCYMENIKMVNCKLLNTDLCFEFSSVDAEISSPIISVKNPISGRIVAKEIGEIILDADLIDPEKTKIVIEKII